MPRRPSRRRVALAGLGLALLAAPVSAHPWALRPAGTAAAPAPAELPDDPPEDVRSGSAGSAAAAAAPAEDPAAPREAGLEDMSVPAPAELAVTDVAVTLQVYRGGERLPSGERAPWRGAVVEGEAVYTLSRPARPGERLVLLNYAEVMQKEPRDLDEIALATYLDGPFDPGRLDVTGHDAAALRRSGPRRDLAVEPAAGAATVRVRYRVKVPHRYWPFGCSRRRCSLSGAVAPLPSEPARGGVYLPPGGRVIAPARWSVDARFASVPTWSPGHVPSDTEAELLDGDEIVVTARTAAGAGPAAYPSVFWGPRWKRVRLAHRGVEVEVLHQLWRPGDQVPVERKAQLYRDIPGHALQVARETIDVVVAAGMEPPPGAPLTIVQGPLRSEVAEAHPTALLLSDQALQLYPGRRFMGFHQAAMARATLDALTYAAYVGAHDPSTDLWLHDAVAGALLDVWRVRRAQSDEYVSDIFRRFTFVPVVDNFLYTGQAAFASSYFRGSEDQIALRLHPLLFSHALPTGRRIHEKLDDVLTSGQRESFYDQVARDRALDPIAAAEKAYGRSLRWFFDQWLGPYPAVDYAVSNVYSEPLRSGGWRHRVSVRRDGERPVIEPVQVLAVEKGGHRHFLVWNGDAPMQEIKDLRHAPALTEHTFTLETDQPLKVVMVDPRARLVETARRPRENVDPLFNNRDPAAFRFVYTGVGLEVAASEFLAGQTSAARLQAISGRVLFEMSRRRDLRSQGHLQVHRDRESAAALGGGASIWFGEKVNKRRRRARVRLYAELHYLSPRSLDQTGGVRFTQSASIIDDNRRFSLWPTRGHRLAFGVFAGETIRDGPVRDHRYNLSFLASWTQIWHLAHRHTLASRLEVSMMVPLSSQPEYRSLIRAGGVDGLGAYGGNEIFGRAVALAQLEYRHMFWTNMNVNLLHLAWVRGLGGAFFAGAATVSGCDDYSGWFGRESWYGQVGYGVTAFLQLLGVTPQFVRFDVGVPLVRRRTTCLGHEHPDYLAELQGLDPGSLSLPRVGVNLTFLQPF